MNRLPLDQAVAARLEEVLADHLFLDAPEEGEEDRTYAAPAVVCGWVPPGLSERGSLVTVLAAKGAQETTHQPGASAEATVRITCRVRANEAVDEPDPYEAGQAELKHLVNLIGQNLLQFPVVEGVYRLTKLEWEMAKPENYDYQTEYQMTHPIYTAVVTGQWQVPAVTANLTPPESVDLMEDGYGE